jgi:hypothetical protein
MNKEKLADRRRYCSKFDLAYNLIQLDIPTIRTKVVVHTFFTEGDIFNIPFDLIIEGYKGHCLCATNRVRMFLICDYSTGNNVKIGYIHIDGWASDVLVDGKLRVKDIVKKVFQICKIGKYQTKGEGE